ncbi:unnamed protein product [Chilo suppressalis]|uniref:PHD-type domain-containing protein n=1 Tax=Chilo suppressalis TaxID=168631 RepID=A0ABN8BB41_CHISP|nr:unnamed protein product [Chilo suppressalis]
MPLICSGCKKPVPKREFLTCKFCSSIYDIECAEVSSQRYYNTMTAEHKNKWKCPLCQANEPKRDNTETPVRARERDQQKCDLLDTQNVTLRKTKSASLNESTSSNEISILGDTAYTAKPSQSNSEVTLENLSQIILERLKENNINIICEIKNTIQKERNTAIMKLKNEIYQETSSIKKVNESIKTNIERINADIGYLTIENTNLKKEIEELQKNFTFIKTDKNPIQNNNKKIVLYGLAEHYKEPEYNLHNRIVQAFQEILQIDITGYIEETRWVGRNISKNRPLEIELLSKRMAKYIVRNNHQFRNTGLQVSEYLDKTALAERKKMRQEMFEARKRGLYAIIKNDQLYIEGRKVNKTIDKNANQVPNLHNTTIERVTSNETQQQQSTQTNYLTNNSFRKQ